MSCMDSATKSSTSRADPMATSGWANSEAVEGQSLPMNGTASERCTGYYAHYGTTGLGSCKWNSRIFHDSKSRAELRLRRAKPVVLRGHVCSVQLCWLPCEEARAARDLDTAHGGPGSIWQQTISNAMRQTCQYPLRPAQRCHFSVTRAGASEQVWEDLGGQSFWHLRFPGCLDSRPRRCGAAADQVSGAWFLHPGAWHEGDGMLCRLRKRGHRLVKVGPQRPALKTIALHL